LAEGVGFGGINPIGKQLAGAICFVARIGERDRREAAQPHLAPLAVPLIAEQPRARRSAVMTCSTKLSPSPCLPGGAFFTFTAVSFSLAIPPLHRAELSAITHHLMT